MVIVHLTSSRFFGGPERQMLELARSLPPPYQTIFLSFYEGGRCNVFLQEVWRRGFAGSPLGHDTPYFRAAVRELTRKLRRLDVRILCCHGYKADLLGTLAARRVGVPCLSVSRGWTGEDWKVRLYEAVDRFVLRWADAVVCVSQGQARKVIDAGVRRERVTVIPNAIRVGRFSAPRPEARHQLEDLFPRKPRWVVGAAGRLSPEKGFDVLIEAARLTLQREPETGFVIFGEGVLRGELQQLIDRSGLGESFVLGGFRKDLDALTPSFDVLAMTSHSEGLPNVLLEAQAAEVPAVCTSVGGIPEVLSDGRNGFLVPDGDAAALAEKTLLLLRSEKLRREMGHSGREVVAGQFSFEAQSRQYQALFQRLATSRRANTLHRRVGRARRRSALQNRGNSCDSGPAGCPDSPN
jgi:glycosyltransferase involved in cell wall biosynthesis